MLTYRFCIGFAVLSVATTLETKLFQQNTTISCFQYNTMLCRARSNNILAPFGKFLDFFFSISGADQFFQSSNLSNSCSIIHYPSSFHSWLDAMMAAGYDLCRQKSDLIPAAYSIIALISVMTLVFIVNGLLRIRATASPAHISQPTPLRSTRNLRAEGFPIWLAAGSERPDRRQSISCSSTVSLHEHRGRSRAGSI